MRVLYYALPFADIPVGAVVLLLLAACSAAVPQHRRLMDVAALVCAAAAVALGLAGEGDVRLLAAALFLVLSVYLYFYNRRRVGK